MTPEIKREKILQTSNVAGGAPDRWVLPANFLPAYYKPAFAFA
jgi:hypothetical protein